MLELGEEEEEKKRKQMALPFSFFFFISGWLSIFLKYYYFKGRPHEMAMPTEYQLSLPRFIEY